MAHAIGCIGTSISLRTKRVQTPKAVSLAKRKSLVPKRNQDRKTAYAVVQHPGDPHMHLVRIRNGQLQDAKSAFCFASVVYLIGANGRKVLK